MSLSLFYPSLEHIAYLKRALFIQQKEWLTWKLDKRSRDVPLNAGEQKPFLKKGSSPSPRVSASLKTLCPFFFHDDEVASLIMRERKSEHRISQVKEETEAARRLLLQLKSDFGKWVSQGAEMDGVEISQRGGKKPKRA